MLFRMVLFTSNFFDFAKPLGFNILIHILCIVIGDAHSKAWAHMVLHLPHAEGGFGVTFNDDTKDAAFYTTTSRFVV